MALTPELQALLKGARNQYSRNTSKVIKPREGKTLMRILQSPLEAKFWRDVAVHWIKPAIDAKATAVVGCSDHTYDRPCPICTAIEKAIAAATSDDELKLIKEWKQQKMVLVNALILDGADKATTPQIVSLTPNTFGAFLGIMETYGDQLGNILDPKTGLDFFLERAGKGFDTKYTWTPSMMSKPVDDEVLNQLNDLDAFIAKEYFRGEENKALATIEHVTGITVALAPPARTAGVLTGPARSNPVTSTVIDAEVIEQDNSVPFDTTPAPAAAAPQDLAAQMAALAAARGGAAPTATVAAVAPTPAAAAPAAAAPTATVEGAFGSQIPTAELDELLAGLDGI